MGSWLEGFSRNNERLQTTASNRINSHRDLNRTVETRRNFTAEGGDLLVNQRHIDWQTHTNQMVTGQNAPPENPKFFSRYLRAHRESTQPKQLVRQLSRDTTLHTVNENCKRKPTVHKTNNRLVKATAAIASLQRPALSAILKPASNNTILFFGENEKFNFFEKFFHTVLKTLAEMTVAMKINHLHALLKKRHYRRSAT